jgi:hypothetical protein
MFLICHKISSAFNTKKKSKNSANNLNHWFTIHLEFQKKGPALVHPLIYTLSTRTGNSKSEYSIKILYLLCCYGFYTLLNLPDYYFCVSLFYYLTCDEKNKFTWQKKKQQNPREQQPGTKKNTLIIFVLTWWQNRNNKFSLFDRLLWFMDWLIIHRDWRKIRLKKKMIITKIQVALHNTEEVHFIL